MLISDNETTQILYHLKKSRGFFEGSPPADRRCSCEKCSISLYRHTHEPDLADFRHSFWGYLAFCVASARNSGLWLEFGVGAGTTTTFIADLKQDRTIYGFDSFEGLPEEWRMSDAKVYPRNKYTREGQPPELGRSNIELITGSFQATLPAFLRRHPQTCSFIHIDCDLYSSTMDVFRPLFHEKRIVAGTVVLFDEFYNYQYFEDHEFRAFRELFGANRVNYRWLAHTDSFVDWNGNQAALIVTQSPAKC